MASEVGICNSALIKLGVERISALTEPNKRAILCNEQYPKIRDSVLYSHPWNFAIKRVTLALTATTPEFGFSSEFQLPSDNLRVLNLDSSSIKWAVEGDKLLADAAAVKARIIWRNTDVSTYTPKCNEALALRLAAELAFPLTQSNNFAKQILDQYEKFLMDARSFDAQEGTPEELEADEWVNSRL